MAKENNGQKGKSVVFNLHVVFSEKDAKRFNNYMLAYANRRGKPVSGLQVKIARRAILDWLDKNEKNLDIKF